MKHLALVLAGLLALTVGCTAPGPGSSGPSLTGTSWVVTAIKQSATVPNSQPSLRFSTDQYSGTTGCNSFSGDFQQSGSTLTLRSAAVTQMACLDAAVMAQETQFLAALADVASVVSTDTGVELRNASGLSVLTLATASDPGAKALIGTTWKLSGTRSGQTASSVIAGSTVTLTLTTSGYSGRACNTFGGDLTTTGSTITFGAPHSTRMACPSPGLTAQETTVLATLPKITSWTITGASLALSTPDGSGLDFVAS